MACTEGRPCVHARMPVRTPISQVAGAAGARAPRSPRSLLPASALSLPAQAEGAYYFSKSSLIQPGKMKDGKWISSEDPQFGKVRVGGWPGRAGRWKWWKPAQYVVPTHLAPLSAAVREIEGAGFELTGCGRVESGGTFSRSACKMTLPHASLGARSAVTA